MAKYKKPEGYKAPLRSRKDIVAFLMGHDSYYRNPPSDNYPLAWNVRDYGSDLSFEHLVEVYRTGGYYDPDDQWLDYPEWLGPAREKYEEVEDKLWEWAIENCQDNVCTFDSHKCLWSGAELDVEYGFTGRSGGWLVMTRFEGKRFRNQDTYEFEEWLDGLPYEDIRLLYQLVVQNDWDFRSEAVSAEIEHQAAFDLIENVCGDIPRPNKTQKMLALPN